MQVKPHAPTIAPARIDLSTFGTTMGVSITELTGTQTGGAPILSYNLQIDSIGGGSSTSVTWTEVAGETTDSLDLEQEIYGLTPGSLYYFRYRAKNAHGFGDYSPV